jgi:predicted small lipoprotein YifL
MRPSLPRHLGILAIAASLAACGRSAPEPPAGEAAPATDASSPAHASAAVETPATADTLRSVVTSIAEGRCTTLEVHPETGGSTQECPGIAGYEVLVLDDDARMSITLRSADGAEHPLDLWGTVTSAFSSLGDSLEWRVRGAGEGAAPTALVVEVRANESPEDPERVTVYRAVAKVGPDESCVTDKLAGAATRDEVLRAADAAPGRPCLAPPEG